MRFVAVSVVALALVGNAWSDQASPLQTRLAGAGLHVTSTFHLAPWWDTAEADPPPIDRVEVGFPARFSEAEVLPPVFVDVFAFATEVAARAYYFDLVDDARIPGFGPGEAYSMVHGSRVYVALSSIPTSLTRLERLEYEVALAAGWKPASPTRRA